MTKQIKNILRNHIFDLNIKDVKIKCLIISNLYKIHFPLNYTMDLSDINVDLLILLGNFSFHSSILLTINVLKNLITINSKYKIIIPGPLDRCFYNNYVNISNLSYIDIQMENKFIKNIKKFDLSIFKKFIILKDRLIKLNINSSSPNIKIYGQAYCPSDKFNNLKTEKYYNGYSFLYDRSSKELIKKRNNIEKCDILLTHCPPLNILDKFNNYNLGCLYLRDIIFKTKPSYHIFSSPLYNKKNTVIDKITFINSDIHTFKII